MVVDREPLVDSHVDHQGRGLQLDEADGIAREHILIPDAQEDLLAGVLDVELELLIPNRGLARIVLDLSLQFLALKCECAVGAHVTQHFSVSGQLRLDHFHVQETFSKFH